MKIGYPKQYYPLDGTTTMLEVTVNRMAAMKLFDRIAVIVSKNDSYIDSCRFAQDVKIYRCGGQTRAQSVLNGLIAAAPADNDWVFVHDAARPCVEKNSIMRLIETVENAQKRLGVSSRERLPGLTAPAFPSARCRCRSR